jgi:hypothetical protein
VSIAAPCDPVCSESSALGVGHFIMSSRRSRLPLLSCGGQFVSAREHVGVAQLWGAPPASAGEDAAMTCADSGVVCPGLIVAMPGCSALTVVGVRQSSNDPHPMPSMGRADVLSTDHERPTGVAASFQCSEHPVSAESSEARHVFNDEKNGSQSPDEPEHLPPGKPAARPLAKSRAFARNADVGTHKAADDRVNATAGTSNSINCDRSDITPPRKIGPVLRQDGRAVGVKLHLAGAAPARAFEAEIVQTDAAVETEEGHVTPPPRGAAVAERRYSFFTAARTNGPSLRIGLRLRTSAFAHVRLQAL